MCLFLPEPHALPRNSLVQPAAGRSERPSIKRDKALSAFDYTSASTFSTANHDTSAFGEHWWRNCSTA